MRSNLNTQSERGNRFVERMLTVTATCRQQDRNVLDYVTAAVEAKLNGIPAHAVTSPPHVSQNSAARKNLPATGIPWHLALGYCRAIGGNLPSEAQWEYAARSPSLPKNPWGNQPAAPLVTALLIGKEPKLKPACSSDRDHITHGGKKICDLAANALEWTRDPFRHSINPQNPPEAFPFGGAAARFWRAVRGLPPLRPCKG